MEKLSILSHPDKYQLLCNHRVGFGPVGTLPLSCCHGAEAVRIFWGQVYRFAAIRFHIVKFPSCGGNRPIQFPPVSAESLDSPDGASTATDEDDERRREIVLSTRGQTALVRFLSVESMVAQNVLCIKRLLFRRRP